jgi:hypothetical protein
MSQSPESRTLLIGARAIARHALGDGGRLSSIYEAFANGSLPLFKFNGRLAAYSDTLDTAMLAKEEEALRTCEQRRQVLAERIAAKALGPKSLTEVAGGQR